MIILLSASLMEEFRGMYVKLIKELNTDIEVQMSILVTDNLYLKELPFLKMKTPFTNKEI